MKYCAQFCMVSFDILWVRVCYIMKRAVESLPISDGPSHLLPGQVAEGTRDLLIISMLLARFWSTIATHFGCSVFQTDRTKYHWAHVHEHVL